MVSVDAEPRLEERVRWANRFYERDVMLRWALIFLLVALVAGFFGFFNLQGTAMWFARVLFFIFLVLLIVSLVLGRRPRV